MSLVSSLVSATNIGPYLILQKLGVGGMGTVYKAKSLKTGEIVAVKVLRPEVAADQILGLRFARECQAMSKLKHAHIVRIIEFGIDGSRPYLAMEYVDGESVGQRLQREGRLPEAEAVRIAVQVGRALHWAHQRRLIHRDVKPDNVLIAAGGDAKLADLGLAKNLEAEYELTRTMSCIGTPNFMAPEQFEDAKRADALSDLYSLGATLYMMVTGAIPFRTSSAKALGTMFKKKLANDLIAPRQLVPDLSERVEDAILQATRADRAERYPSLPAFLAALNGTRCSPARPAGETPLPRRTVLDRGPTADRRKRKRYRSQRGTSCLPLQRCLDERWAGQVVDVSDTGLCLQLGRRFEPGTMLTVLVDGDPKARKRSLVVRVVWVKNGPKANTWLMGCELDQPLCDFEVQELL
jgi:serine/threonine protein kinase